MLENLIELMQSSDLPPWRSGYTSLSVPVNHAGVQYRGINRILLGIGSSRSYKDNRWYTFKKALELKHPVKAGSKGEHIVRYIPIPLDKNDPKSKTSLVPKVYVVFNGECLEGLPPLDIDTTAVTPVNEVLDQIMARHHPEVEETSDTIHPCYIPGQHKIRMPLPGQYKNKDQYLATLGHELVHWTLKPLERKMRSYAEEELVAEFGSTLLGMPYDPINSAAYLKGWARDLTAQRIMACASAAQKAADFLLGVIQNAEPVS